MTGGASLAQVLRMPVAALSLAVAGIHFAVVPDHLQEFAPYGWMFLALAWFQVLWPIPYLTDGRVVLGWLGVVVNLGAVLVWLWSRTLGLPFGPVPGEAEAAGPLDITASVFEASLVCLLGLLLVPRLRPIVHAARFEPRRAWLGAGVATALIILLASVALLVPSAAVAMP